MVENNMFLWCNKEANDSWDQVIGLMHEIKEEHRMGNGEEYAATEKNDNEDANI